MTNDMASSQNDRTDGGWPRCPLLHVIKANEFGLVVESERAFEIGAGLTMGFHLDKGDGTAGHFISTESLVVDCQPCLSRGQMRHRITLLFSDISAEDRTRLIGMSEKPNSPASRYSSMGMN